MISTVTDKVDLGIVKTVAKINKSQNPIVTKSDNHCSVKLSLKNQWLKLECGTVFAKDSVAEQKKFNPAPSEGWVPSSPVILSPPWNNNGGVASSSIKPQVGRIQQGGSCNLL